MSKFEKLFAAKKEGGTEMEFQNLPELSVFLPFPKGSGGSKRIKINPTEDQIKKAGLIPDPRVGYAVDLENTLSDSVGESLSDFFERYRQSPWFIRQIRQYNLDRVCTYFGQLFDLFPSL